MISVLRSYNRKFEGAAVVRVIGRKMRALLAHIVEFARSSVGVRLNADDDINAMTASQLKDIGVTKEELRRPFGSPFL